MQRREIPSPCLEHHQPEQGDAPEAVKRRHIANCAKADPAYGAGVAKALGLSV